MLLAGVTVLLAACASEEPLPDEARQATASPDADGYVARAEQFVEASRYDSALVYFEKAGVLYEAAQAWERYVHCHNAMGEQAEQMGAYAEALTYLGRALEVGRQQLGDDHPEVARAYHGTGSVYRLQGRFDEALQALETALAIRLRTLGEDHPDVAESYHAIGIVYGIRSAYDRALDLFGKALAIRLRTLGEDHPQTAQSYLGLGNVHNLRGEYDEAIDAYEKALAIWTRAGREENLETAKSYNNLGVVYSKKGDQDGALRSYQKALAIWIPILGEDHPLLANVYNNIGTIFGIKGDINEALSFFEKALAIRLPILGEDHPETANLYNNIGMVYHSRGDYEQALEAYHKSLAIRRARLGENHPLTAKVYSDIANVYAEQYDFAQALSFYRKALAARANTLEEHDTDLADLYVSLGHALAGTNDFGQARAFFDKALALLGATVGSKHPAVSSAYAGIASTYRSQGDYEQALHFYRRSLCANLVTCDVENTDAEIAFEDALSELWLIDNLQGQALTLARRAATPAGTLEDLRSALVMYQRTLDALDQVRTSYRAEASKLTLVSGQRHLYEEAVQTALALYEATGEATHKATAFEFIEKSRAGALLDAFLETEAQHVAGIPDSLLQQQRQLRLDLAYYERTLLTEQTKPAQIDSARVAALKEKVFGLKRRYDLLIDQLERDYPAYYTLKYQTWTASVEQVQQHLVDDQTALVEYFSGQDSLFIFTITRDAHTVTSVAWDIPVAEQVDAVRQSIIEQQYAPYVASAYRLYQQVLEPVEEQIRGKRLLLIPDGLLSYVPFEALLTRPVEGADEDGVHDYSRLPYLVQRHAVSYGYSATLLLETMNRNRNAASRDFVAFAPVFAQGLPAGTRGASLFAANVDSSHDASRAMGALPASRGEVTGIYDLFNDRYGFFGRLFGNKSSVFLERDATEARAKSLALDQYRYVHFATHGFVNEAEPTLSGIVLTPDTTTGEDGVLQLGEIYNLRLNADLAVLSACETGLGKLARGEGIIGLTRGFLYAGAENVLVSLWQADDATTATLMVDFYEAMLGGEAKAEALSRAKRALIHQDPRYAKPYYWSSFILVGQ